MKKEEARRLRMLGLTLEETGEILGISKQRVYQMVGDIKVVRDNKEEVVCFTCGKKSLKSKKRYKGEKVFCSADCRAVGLRKKVVKISKEGMVLKIYDSIGDAAKDVGCSHTQVGKASNPNVQSYKTAGGYIWRRI
jgi:endogenous inhibitor of DNA gyrase (YacG/DUF329 family)